jgi:hypothetical protein
VHVIELVRIQCSSTSVSGNTTEHGLSGTAQTLRGTAARHALVAPSWLPRKHRTAAHHHALQALAVCVCVCVRDAATPKGSVASDSSERRTRYAIVRHQRARRAGPCLLAPAECVTHAAGCFNMRVLGGGVRHDGVTLERATAAGPPSGAATAHVLWYSHARDRRHPRVQGNNCLTNLRGAQACRQACVALLAPSRRVCVRPPFKLNRTMWQPPKRTTQDTTGSDSARRRQLTDCRSFGSARRAPHRAPHT